MAPAFDPMQAQAVVDPLVEKAKDLLGDSLTGVSVDLPTETVHLAVYNAPTSALTAVQSLAPSAFIISSAAHSYAELASAQDQIASSAVSWFKRGVDVRRIGISSDGTLEVGVASDVPSAQAQLDSAYGSGLVKVVYDNTIVHLDTFRYDDVAPWNGAGFIYQRGGGNCTGGTPVHDSAGTNYIVTAAHCVGDSSVSYRNGYINDTTGGEVGSKTIMGPLTHVDCICGGTYPSDEALIQTNSSVVDFNDCWNCQGRATQEGRKDNTVGDQACIDGAFEGQRCGVVIKGSNLDLCVSGTCRGHVSYGCVTTTPLLVAKVIAVRLSMLTIQQTTSCRSSACMTFTIKMLSSRALQELPTLDSGNAGTRSTGSVSTTF